MSLVSTSMPLAAPPSGSDSPFHVGGSGMVWMGAGIRPMFQSGSSGNTSVRIVRQSALVKERRSGSGCVVSPTL
jgi:hypothetical protein